MTENQLKAAGYRLYPRRQNILKNADLWQKAILTSGGQKAFFINLWSHAYEDCPGMDEKAKMANRWELDVQFSLSNGDVFNVSRGVSSMPLAEVESWLKGVYQDLRCIPDVHNN